jgi:hypothetical protein
LCCSGPSTNISSWEASNPTDRRCHQYLRLYVGQTIRSWRRFLVEHVQAILRGNVSSLHYFILWLGNGYRSANFLRLWTLPTGKDDRWRQATINILECLFARVLRSHHGTCSPEDAQLDPNTLLDGYGLNIMSPLLQRHAIKDGDTILFVMPPHDRRVLRFVCGTISEGRDVNASSRNPAPTGPMPTASRR